jgi:hypothetical protein
MTVENLSTVVGVFQDQSAAQKAVAELRRMGFREDQIGVVTRETQRASTSEEVETDDATSHVGTGAATGAIAGAGVGALWALGIVTLGLPAVGPVIAGGILASVLASAAGTAVAGGIVGALVGLGIPEVTVQTADNYRDAENILHNHGAYNVHTARPNMAGTV